LNEERPDAPVRGKPYNRESKITAKDVEVLMRRRRIHRATTRDGAAVPRFARNDEGSVFPQALKPHEASEEIWLGGAALT